MSKLNKEDLFDYINDLQNDLINIYNEDELETHSREGIYGKYEIGEYAFPEFEEQYEYDMLIEDNIESCKAECGYDGDIEYVTWSSKSGTSVFVDAFEYDYNSAEDLLNNIGYEHDFEFDYSKIEDFTYSQLVALKNDLVDTLELVQDARKEYDKQLVEIEKIISSGALGTRSGCFSNGEVIFSPTDTYEGATELFTPYYNPNEEVA